MGLSVFFQMRFGGPFELSASRATWLAFGVEAGGRWSEETPTFVGLRARAPAALHQAARSAFAPVGTAAAVQNLSHEQIGKKK